MSFGRPHRYERAYPNPLSQFLIQRAAQNFQLANFFHWFVAVEMHNKDKGQIYATLQSDFHSELNVTKRGMEWRVYLEQQDKLVVRLTELTEAIKNPKAKVAVMKDRMKACFAGDTFADLKVFPSAMPHPLKPDLTCFGIDAEKAPREGGPILFTSAMAPICHPFRIVTDPAAVKDPKKAVYRAIFKSGDDLRQDQFVINMICLMDRLWKQVNLDLRLTPYRILATGPKEGFLEFVEGSKTLTDILAEYNDDIRKYFDAHNTKASDMQATLDNFVRSLAGYSVITYILGVGDRHLENLMMTSNGKLFHIDFGFIMGRDPKPWPSPIRLNRQMVEAMGGNTSEQYQGFQKHCCQAYNILRKSSNLILNLIALMLDSGIPDLTSVSGNGDLILLKVEEKLRLDLSDEEAERHLMKIINDSVSVFWTETLEFFHNVAIYNK